MENSEENMHVDIGAWRVNILVASNKRKLNFLPYFLTKLFLCGETFLSHGVHYKEKAELFADSLCAVSLSERALASIYIIIGILDLLQSGTSACGHLL